MMRTQLTSAMRSSVARASLRTTTSAPIACRAASTHAISNPTLSNIEKRWEGMPLQEQAELWMALRDRMKENWTDLTLQEKKAAYWIAFGPHGPRTLPPPGENTKVLVYTLAGLGLTAAIFLSMRVIGSPEPHTMTKEWQEATNEYLKEQKTDPFNGIGAEDYTGPGHVQSPSGKP